MPGIKTAISLEEDLFDKANKLADEMKVSRSRLFSIALEDYLKRRENQTLLERLNQAYRDCPDDEEIRISHAMKGKYKKMIRRESW